MQHFMPISLKLTSPYNYTHSISVCKLLNFQEKYLISTILLTKGAETYTTGMQVTVMLVNNK